MPLTEPLRSGARVMYDGREYTIRLNGTSVYLHDVHSREPCIRTVRRTTLLRRGQAAAVVVESVALPRPPLAPEHCRVPSQFLYVVRDCDLPRSDRRVKIGISGSIPITLATYRRIMPNAQAIVVADCRTEARARALEATCKQVFAEFRVDDSEVYELRPHEVARWLRREGFHQMASGLFACRG